MVSDAFSMLFDAVWTASGPKSEVESFLQGRACRVGPALFDMAMYRMANGGLTPHPKLVGEASNGLEWP